MHVQNFTLYVPIIVFITMKLVHFATETSIYFRHYRLYVGRHFFEHATSGDFPSPLGTVRNRNHFSKQQKCVALLYVCRLQHAMFSRSSTVSYSYNHPLQQMDLCSSYCLPPHAETQSEELPELANFMIIIIAILLLSPRLALCIWTEAVRGGR